MTIGLFQSVSRIETGTSRPLANKNGHLPRVKAILRTIPNPLASSPGGSDSLASGHLMVHLPTGARTLLKPVHSSTAAAPGDLPRPPLAAMHASSSSNPAHVVSDDQSHSSYVVDRPTVSACSSPTMNCPCESAARARSRHHHYRYLRPIARPVPCRTSEITSPLSLLRRGFVLEAAFCMGDALVQCLSRSIQYNSLVLDKTSDAVLAAACTFKYETLHRSDSALALEPSLRHAPAVDVHKRHRVARAVRWRRDVVRDDDVAVSPAAACGVPRSLLGDIRREGDGRAACVKRYARRSCTGQVQLLRAVVVVNGRGGASEVEAVRPGIEVGATVRASRAYATTRKSPRSGVTCDSVAQACDVACYNEGSGQRGVRRDVTRDRQRPRQSDALSSGVGNCFQCPMGRWWGVMLAIPLGGGERGVRAACGGGSSVEAWHPRDVCCGALLTSRRACANLSSGADYAGPSAVSTDGGSSASQSNYSASSMNYRRTPPAHTYTSSSSPSDAYNPTSTPLHHTALDVQQRLGPRHTHAGPDASTATLRVRGFMRIGFSERGEYG
ncbi:hypothetical protein DFH08DRAFT_816878 [Mycena albidolilacea]|uniref:Uncharacterized protein n=1 Tax=Mycena albidolilacea TaxID=1033008 RepID=A0AAD6ZK88_9AGAR|nr:hypothetical protein DFH08DRAFT_816878 [Mycena albidolilacea]